MRYPGIAIILLTLLPLAAFAQESDDSTVTAVELSGREQSGTLAGLNEQALVLGGETPQQLALDELLAVRFGDRNAAALEGALVVMASGDRFSVQPAVLNDDDLVTTWNRYPGWPQLNLPLEQIRAIGLQLPEETKMRHRLVASLSDYGEKQDTVVLRNGDRLGGQLENLSATSLEFAGPVGKISIPRGDVRAVMFNSDLISRPPESGKRLLVELTDGSRFTARRAAAGEQGMVEVETQFGAKLSLPSSAIVSLRFLGGKAVYLSDLEAAEFQFVPFLESEWPLQLDRNVTGGPLRLNGREFAKGLGMHSKSIATYELSGKYRRFRAVVGIDDTAGKEGSVRFAVEVDGERRCTSELVTGESEPLSVGPIDVEGKQRLTLIVEFGDRGDILDHADWCDAILIR